VINNVAKFYDNIHNQTTKDIKAFKLIAYYHKYFDLLISK